MRFRVSMTNVKWGISLGVLSLAGISALSWRADTSEVNLTSNEYKVLTVQGRIVFEQTGKDMQRGDLYVTGTPLNFTTQTSRAAIVNDENGRYVLSSSKGKLKVLPAANNVSSRSGAILNVVDLKNHFTGRYLVLDVAKIPVGAESFPINETSFFYLTYVHNGEEIPKKLKSDGANIILDADEIFKIDGNPIPVTEKEMTLYYKSDKTYKINTFTPVFADETILKEEVSILLESFEKADNAKKISEITAYLNEFYGSPSKENLAGWLKKEFGIE
ncbi:MAG: hypothetical protein HYZ14_13615 [Bacteroidetes bacterium]|nr:hypothetical protein [Bacteroidota bacterium]